MNFFGKVQMFCDGASRGNPGRASSAFWIQENGTILFEGGEDLGIATNNVAEWSALLFGLKKAKEIGIKNMEVFLDSELVVKQIKGEYRVRNSVLFPIFQSVQSLLPFFESLSFIHIPRENNKKADAIANNILDNQKNLL
jgi:ribonuclease HI